MSWLGDIYQKTKKKLEETLMPVEQKVSSGLGAMARGIRNFESGIKNYFAPTPQVRMRDVVREIPQTVYSFGQGIRNNVVNPIVEHTTKTVAPAIVDVAVRTSPIEPIRNFIGGIHNVFKDDRKISPVLKFQEGFYKSQARPTFFEKANNVSLTKPTGGIDWKQGRKFIGGAMEAPTYFYSGLSGFKPTAGKLLNRVGQRTLRVMPEAAINTGTQLMEESINPIKQPKEALKTFGLNTALMGGMANLAELKGRPVGLSITENRGKSKAFKVMSGDAESKKVAELNKSVRKQTGLPRDIIVKKEFFEKMSQSHPEIDKNKLLNFVKTLHIPDEVSYFPSDKKLNFFKQLENEAINIVSTGKDWNLPQSNVITSFNVKPNNQSRIGYLENLKNTSSKVFPKAGGTRQIPSSDILSEVPRTGARFSRSSAINNTTIKPKILQETPTPKDIEEIVLGRKSYEAPSIAKPINDPFHLLPEAELGRHRKR